MIKENSKAPNFKLPSSNNKDFEINKSLNQYLVVYFYPRDNTPGCTNEAKDFSRLQLPQTFTSIFINTLFIFFQFNSFLQLKRNHIHN